MNIRRLFSHKGPPLRPGQTEEDRDAQLAAAKAKRERRAAKQRKLVESGQLQLSGQPQYVPWEKAAKDLHLERLGVDHGSKSPANAEELYEPARLEDKERQ